MAWTQGNIVHAGRRLATGRVGATRLPVGMLLLAAAVLAFACSDDDSSKDTSNLASETQAVVRRSVQALIDHDDAAYFNELHPDYRADASRAPDSNQDLSGCVINDVKVPGDIEAQNSTVIFSKACGTDPGDGSRPLVGCSVDVAILDGRPYTLNYACTP